MARFSFSLRFSISLVFVASGCSSKSAFKEQPAASAQLMAIGRAYGLATQNLDRGPQGKQELKPYLGEDWADKDVYRSPTDAQEFVIIWGLDYRDLDLNRPGALPVFAYEKEGKDGKRYVLQGIRHVVRVADEDLAKLPFPQGVRPPS